MTTDSIETLIDEWEDTRKSCAILYFKWIKEHGILEMLGSPETLPSIYYQKKWANSTFEFVEEIFSFLSSFNIFIEASGTYILNENYQKLIHNIESGIKSPQNQKVTTDFVSYGLKRVESKLDGDTGEWDLIQNSFLFERGITQKALELYCFTVRNYIRDNFALTQDDANYLYYSPFILCPLIKMSNSLDFFKEIAFIVPTEFHKKQLISFCELHRGTSKYSPNVHIDIEYQKNIKFDVIWIPMILGFYNSIKDQVKYIQGKAKVGSYQFWFHPKSSEAMLGIETFFKLHPRFDSSYTGVNYSKILVSQGFSEVTRIGYKNSILVTKKV